MEKNVTAFIEYLKAQMGEPYLWGGQHTRLTPENYVRIIERKEAGRGGYPDGTSYAQACIDFCKQKFEEGATVLYAYDCSGLGCYWLCNLTHLYRCDVNANTMMGRCILKNEPPKRGWWVFRLDGKRASHIGYMIDDEYLVEAKGRKYGVVKTKFRAKDWACWGIPQVFEKELTPEPEPQPEPPVPTPGRFVEVVGKSVNVRTSDSKKGRLLFTAHRGDRFPFLAVAPSGWYEIDTKKGQGFITNLARYTKLI
ncbi:MAG: SH3 domain-containing protein [Clostridia bacterium]|nr:SH3 domain-containing protein [Clostridia bacterium]